MVRKNVLEGGGSTFGIGIVDADESISGAEVLGSKLSWCLLVPLSHSLAEHAGPVSADMLASEDRFFLPSCGLACPGMDTFLATVGRTCVVETDSALGMVAAGLGLGVIPDLFGNQEPEGMAKLSLPELGQMQLRLYLPRQGTTLSDPAQSLCESLRRVVEARLAPAPAPENGNGGEHGSEPQSILEPGVAP
jgi:DNA-binding transcriptional LysR family regulator